MKKVITWIITLSIIALGAFFYLTRPVEEPAQDIASSSQSETLPLPKKEEVKNETLYRISQNDSKVQFVIEEDLRGKPFTVVGSTNQIAGDISISQIEGQAPKINVGTIKIDARTFVTDSSSRDNAVNRFILKTETSGNEYITFTPTSIPNTSSVIEKGKPFMVTVSGKLTISGITKSYNLTATLTQNDGILSGITKMNLKRSDFNLVIPNIPFVANVPDTFDVSATFVASKVQ